MLFLVKGELKQLPPIQPQQFLEIAVQEWETVINYQKQGKILSQGVFAGRKGGCFICDVESIEELNTLISQSPMFAFMEMEIIPLINIENALESAKRALETKQTSIK